MPDPNAQAFVYPASYFVFAYLFLLTAIMIVLFILARRTGSELDREEIKYKVFDDGIANPRTEPQYRYEGRRPAAAPAGTDQD
ncbi:MAG TPA: hypothetical protein VFD70_08950 [Anaerolineae bacterium]|nr:hypothetical protein [Anaerolineae bacterium]